MKFATFTRTLPANVQIFINPAQVIAVDTYGANTRIHTTAAASDTASGVETIMVIETAAQVAQQLELAANS